MYASQVMAEDEKNSGALIVFIIAMFNMHAQNDM